MDDFSKKYHEILFGEFSTLNLTRIKDPAEFHLKQIVDSIQPIDSIPYFKQLMSDTRFTHVDVGFGGGFPLLPLANLYPRKKFYGFEARRKKADAVGRISKLLGIKNISTYHCRIEDLLIDTPSVITFKAVGKIVDFLPKINSTEKVSVCFYKGSNLLELEKTPDKVRSFHKKLLSEYELPDGTKRYFVIYEGKNVPRGTKKDLVKLTELL